MVKTRPAAVEKKQLLHKDLVGMGTSIEVPREGFGEFARTLKFKPGRFRSLKGEAGIIPSLGRHSNVIRMVKY